MIKRVRAYGTHPTQATLAAAIPTSKPSKDFFSPSGVFKYSLMVLMLLKASAVVKPPVIPIQKNNKQTGSP